MKQLLSLILLCLCLSGCKTPGTNTGNPEDVASPVQPSTDPIPYLAEYICDTRKACFQLTSSNCAQDLMTTPGLAAMFTYPTSVSTWQEVKNGLSDGHWKTKEATVITCAQQMYKIKCADPQVEAALNQVDFTNLDVLFNLTPACRDIIADPSSL